jgi:ferric-dicitrate binding protein FerR (iron transport regulator)
LNELEDEERAAIEQWINENAANAKQYEAVQQLLQQPVNTLEAIHVDTDKGWAELNAKIALRQTEKGGKVRSMGRYWAAAAAIIGILLVGGWWFLQSAGGASEEWIAKTGFDTLQLADGTYVIADGNATIKYKKNFNQGNRDVQLEGNAFFQVRRDTTSPFSVAFTEGKVTVLGTQFFINQQAEGFNVKVTEGKVKTELIRSAGEVILTRGKMVLFTKAANQFQVQDFAETSMLKYNNVSLQAILKDLFLSKGIKVQTDQALAEMQLTVDFVQSTPEEILQALELLTQGQLQKIGVNQYRLTKN